MTTTTYPPLGPPDENGERQFYHYRKDELIDVLTMRDRLARHRVGKYGQQLWPVEWGFKPPGVIVK